MMLAIATPEMINPVADQCEANGVPCLSTLAPWQPYFFGRGGDPAVGFDWTYHFFWGADQLVGVFTDMWNTIETNKVVGLLCPNDPDGNALADPETGFPAGADRGRLHGGRPGPLRVLSDDFSAIIGEFKDENVEIVVGIPIPPDFATFWTQAKQQDFNPKLVTMAKAVLFSSAVEALGDDGDGLASEIWWTPTHPFSQLADRRHLARARRQVRPRRPASSGRSSSASCTPCSSQLRRRSTRRHHRQASDRRRRRSDQLDTIVGPMRFGADGRAQEHVARRRWSAASGSRSTAGSSRSTSWSPTTAWRREIPRAASSNRSPEADSVCALLDVVDVSQRFGGLPVVDAFSFDLAARRGPRHRRAERRRQDHAAEPGRRRPAPTRARPFEGIDMTAAGARRCRLGHRAHRADPAAVRGLSVFENVLVGAHIRRAGGCAAPPTRPPSRPATHRDDRHGQPLAGTLDAAQRKRLELARALATQPACCCSTRSPVG